MSLKHLLDKLFAEKNIDPSDPSTNVLALVNNLAQDKKANSQESLRLDTQKLLASQHDIVFFLDLNAKVTWYKADNQLKQHLPNGAKCGGPISEYFPHDASRELTTLIDDSLHSNDVNTGEIQLGTSGETPSYYSVNVVVTSLKQVVLLMHDISAQKREEQHASHAADQLKQLNRLLLTLHKELSELNDRQQTQQIMLKAMLRALAGDAASIWHLDAKYESLHLHDSLGYKLKKKPVPIVRTSAPHYFNALFSERVNAIHNREVAQKTSSQEINTVFPSGSAAILDAPILSDGKVIGMLRIEKCQAHQWNDNEQAFFASLADLYAQMTTKLIKLEKAAALNGRENHFKALTEMCDTAIFAFDNTLLYANPALQTLTGETRQSFIDVPVERVFGQHFSSRHSLAKQGQSSESEEKNIQSEVSITTPRGELRWLYITSTLSNFEGKTCWLASAFDITERKTSEARLKYQANHDQLTGLPNRQRLLERIDAGLTRSSRDRFYRFATCCINIDRFKVFNDSMGQLIGDQILLELSKRIRLCLQPSDITARISSDEFALYIDNVFDEEDVAAKIRSVQTALEDPISFGDQETVCSANIGIAIGSHRYERSEHVLRDASIAMYRAKEQSQQDFLFFDKSMHDYAKRILEIENELRLAIRDEALELFYQPIIDLKNGTTSYFEALIRWRKNKDTLISPLDFIPLAEETKIILSLGQWVAERACRQLVTWQNAGHSEIGISINVSGKQFESGNITEEINALMQHYAIGKNRLKIEITETSMIENAETIQQQLQALRTLGCELLVDDFGTGYSSLSYLHKFPMHCIKIDRSFIANLYSEEDSVEVVRAITNLAHNLKLNVVAEGVENAEQEELLKKLGCDYAQGFYYSQPVPENLAFECINKHWGNHHHIALAKTSR